MIEEKDILIRLIVVNYFAVYTCVRHHIVHLNFIYNFCQLNRSKVGRKLKVIMDFRISILGVDHCRFLKHFED